MGRKIPAKKHRGVKDPLVQQARRVDSLKGKINAPPRDPDEQPVPKSLLRLFGAPAVERRERRPRPAVRAPRGGSAPHAAHSVTQLQRLPGESARGFSKRITGATRALHTAEDPHHYPHEEEEDEEEWPSRRRKGRGGVPAAPRETKAQRRKLKLQQRKQEAAKLREADASSSLVYERVSFGEQVHAPPALPAPRLPLALREQAGHVPRPGRRDLLLSHLLPGDGGKTGGGKGAGDARGDAAELRRLAAVRAYRELKKQKRADAAR